VRAVHLVTHSHTTDEVVSGLLVVDKDVTLLLPTAQPTETPPYDCGLTRTGFGSLSFSLSLSLSQLEIQDTHRLEVLQ
jgi:hypothetical protein